MTNINLVDRKKWPPIGYCLYCGSTKNLTREHVVPLSLGGNWVLPKASCESCSRITGEFERRVARDMLWAHRVQMGYRTRHKDEKPSQLTIDVHTKGGIEHRKIPIENSPTLPVIMPILEPPDILLGKPPKESAAFCGWIWYQPQDSTPQKERLAAIHGNVAKSISVDLNVNLNGLMRMLAKIAHCHATARYGQKVKSYLPDHPISTYMFSATFPPQVMSILVVRT